MTKSEVIELLEELGETIYERTIAMKNTEYFDQGIANKLRTKINKAVEKTKEGWNEKSGTKKVKDLSKANEHLQEVIRFLKIAKNMISDRGAQDMWDMPLELATKTVAKLERLLFANKAKVRNRK